MRELVLTPKFKRAFRRLVKKNRALQVPIETTLRRMVENLDQPTLRTHHLSGKLEGLFACSCGYDCRIVFKRFSKPNGGEVLMLINIGSHDEVY